MKSKAPLVLMEQMVMLLVFALAASLCLQAFVKSDEISLKSQAKSNAAMAAQNVAELLRHNGGSYDHALRETAGKMSGSYVEGDGGAEGRLEIFYDREWKAVKEGDYLLTAEGVLSPEQGLQRVRVQVADLASASGDKEVLFELEATWLEVETDE